MALARAQVFEEAIEKRRANDRERQARRNVNSREVTLDHVQPTEVPPAPNKSPPDPQKLTPTPASPPETRARGGPFPCPEGVNPDHWRDFLANRKTKRLTNTPTAYRQALKALETLSDDEWPPGRIVEFAAAAGWAAIHDPRTSYRTTGNGRSGTYPVAGNQPDGLGRTARAAARAFPDAVRTAQAGHT